MGGLFTIQSVSDTILHRSFCTSQSIEQSKGEGNVDLTTKKVAVALDSLMQIKRMIIAGFNVKEMILNETNFSAITDAVEKTVHTESNADFRLGLTYGSEADYLYNQSTGNAPAINFFFAEDADIIYLSAENRAKIYYLDITDEGSNYNSIFTLFNGLRGAEAPVQYRVRNGQDSEQSAQTGIYSMSYYINEHIHIVELSVIAVAKIRVETFRHDVDQWAKQLRRKRPDRNRQADKLL